MNIKRLNKRAVYVLSLAWATILGAASTALVYAAIPSSSDGQIHACYRNGASLTDAKGAVRVIDSQTSPAEKCTAQETSLNFNQSGANGLVKDLSNIDFHSSSADGSGLNYAFFDLRGVNFSGSNVSSASFKGADLRTANLTGANLSSSDFTNAIMSGLFFENVDLTSAIFTGANITGATWSNATCPDGNNSNDYSNSCVGHLNL